MLEDLKRIMDKATAGWYFGILCGTAILHFGSGVMFSQVVQTEGKEQRARIERAIEAERSKIQEQLDDCRTGNFCKIDHGENRYRFLAISAKNKELP